MTTPGLSPEEETELVRTFAAGQHYNNLVDRHGSHHDPVKSTMSIIRDIRSCTPLILQMTPSDWSLAQLAASPEVGRRIHYRPCPVLLDSSGLPAADAYQMACLLSVSLTVLPNTAAHCVGSIHDLYHRKDPSIQHSLRPYANLLWAEFDDTCNDSLNAIVTITEQYRPLVEKIARTHWYNSYPEEDLLQEGFLGLLTALDKFDYRRGTRFSTYAYNFIKHGVCAAATEISNNIHIPQDVLAHSLRLRRTERKDQCQSDQNAGATAQPTPTNGAILPTLSLEMNVGIADDQDDHSDDELTLAHQLTQKDADPADILILKDVKQCLSVLLDQLPDQEAHIVRSLFGFAPTYVHTQRELAALMAIPVSEIRSTEKRAIAALRHMARAQNLSLDVFA